MNDITNPDLAGLMRLLDALDPWLSQIVIIGGWAHRLLQPDTKLWGITV